MATPSTAYFGLTGDETINALTTGYYWTLNADRTIDWSISKGPMDEEWASIAGAIEYVGAALFTFSYYANVKFNYVGAYTRPSVAAAAGSEINFAWAGSAFPLFALDARYAGFAFFPNNTEILYQGEAGDIFFSTRTDLGYTSHYGPGSAVFSLFIHEIGHSLGLKHPHDDGGTGRPTLRSLGYAQLDKDWATVMSYNDDANWNATSWDPATPMILDVIALQFLYGKNWTTNAGNSTFTLGRTGYYLTLWDASGDDWVDASNQTEGWVIALPDSPISNLVDTEVGLTFPVLDLTKDAPQTLYWLAGQIENAAGSNWADALSGSRNANRFVGNGGDDFIDGGAGLDVAIYSGTSRDYQIQKTGDGFVLADLRGTDGVDTLTGIERLQFSTSQVALDLGANQAGGMAALLMGAVLGRQSLFAKKELLGAVVRLFDAGVTFGDLAGAVMRLDVWDILAGGNTSAQIADYLLNTVNGAAPGPEIIASAVEALNSNRGDFLWHLAESTANQTHINLVGLSQVGIEYL